MFPIRALAFAFVACFVAALTGTTPGRAAYGQAVVQTVTVDAQANVFGAGVGGIKANGGGKKPVVIQFEPFKKQVLWFTNIAGKVSCCSGGSTFNGPEGGTNAGGSTDIQSSGGISGIIDKKRTMFLVGVFVGYPGPAAPGPARLDVTYSAGQTDIFPRLDQVFYIGRGTVLGSKTPQKFHVPQGANHLVLGFADAYSFNGSPGAYDDNQGELTVKLRLTPTQ